MAAMTVFVAGSGTAGRAYVRELLAAGHRVRVSVRPGAESDALTALGAEPVALDFRDAEGTRTAVSGAEAVVVALLGRGGHPAADEELITRNVFDAAQAAGSRLVYTSVHLADEPTGVPHFEVKGRLERELAHRDLNTTVLRPTTFMDALAAPWLRQTAVQQGVLRSPIAIDTPISYVATSDLARFCVAALARPAMAGQHLTVAGPEAVTYAQLLPRLSRLAGREIHHEQLPLEALARTAGPGIVAMTQLFNTFGFVSDTRAVFSELGIEPTFVTDYLAASAWALSDATNGEVGS